MPRAGVAGSHAIRKCARGRGRGRTPRCEESHGKLVGPCGWLPGSTAPNGRALPQPPKIDCSAGGGLLVIGKLSTPATPRPLPRAAAALCESRGLAGRAPLPLPPRRALRARRLAALGPQRPLTWTKSVESSGVLGLRVCWGSSPRAPRRLPPPPLLPAGTNEPAVQAAAPVSRRRGRLCSPSAIHHRSPTKLQHDACNFIGSPAHGGRDRRLCGWYVRGGQGKHMGGVHAQICVRTRADAAPMCGRARIGRWGGGGTPVLPLFLGSLGAALWELSLTPSTRAAPARSPESHPAHSQPAHDTPAPNPPLQFRP